MPSVMNTALATGDGFNTLLGATRDVYSAEIWFAALPVLKFDQFTTKKTELGVQPGNTINIPKHGNLKRGGRLTEGVRMKTQPMSLTSQSLKVFEYGNAVGFSEYLLQVSFYDQLSAASILLGRDFAVVLDMALRDKAVSGVSVVYAGTGHTARNQVTATDVMSTTVVKDVVEVLQTANAPKWAGDHYIGFLHPHQARGIRDDVDWINAAQYAGSGQIYTGEIGRYEDVRFITTTVMPNGKNAAVDSTGDYADIGYSAALDGTGAAGIDIYQAVFFGEYSIGFATGLPVELRDNGVEDFGREHGLAWFSIFGQGLLETANIVVAETA